jgi:hypothetical protein
MWTARTHARTDCKKEVVLFELPLGRNGCCLCCVNKKQQKIKQNKRKQKTKQIFKIKKKIFPSVGIKTDRLLMFLENRQF